MLGHQEKSLFSAFSEPKNAEGPDGVPVGRAPASTKQGGVFALDQALHEMSKTELSEAACLIWPHHEEHVFERHAEGATLSQELRRVYNHPAAMLLHHEKKTSTGGAAARDAERLLERLGGADESADKSADKSAEMKLDDEGRNVADGDEAPPWWHCLWPIGRFSSAEATARHLSGKVMLALQITAAAAAAGERTLLFSQASSPDLPK